MSSSRLSDRRKRRSDSIGRRIPACREAAGLTQEQLAEAAEIHPRSLQKIEAGENCPMLSTLERLQRALRCPWEALFP